MPTLRRRTARAFGVAIVVGIVACGKDAPKGSIVPGADAERGKFALARYGCGSCHTIPGIRDARGLVGPPLAGMASRVYIAGVLPNDPNNLVRWVMNPPGIDSLTAMPYLGVSERDARDMAEYLYRPR